MIGNRVAVNVRKCYGAHVGQVLVGDGDDAQAARPDLEGAWWP